MKLRRSFLTLIVTTLALAASTTYADVEVLITQAMASDTRSAEERERDANRKPLETLQFLRLQEDMRVLELLPGGGWYTKILAPVLKERRPAFCGRWYPKGRIHDCRWHTGRR